MNTETIETITVKFKGYWRGANATGVPNDSGIYCVYSCRNDNESWAVIIDDLLYIGQSDCVQDSIYDEDRNYDWFERLDHEKMQELCFSFCQLPTNTYSEGDRKNIVANLIQHNTIKPTCRNDELDMSIFSKIQLKTSGANFHLDRYLPSLEFGVNNQEKTSVSSRL